MIILSIETSCDDTGVALLDIKKGGKVKIIADFVSSQTQIHAPYGGVVPNLAVRAHYKNLPILLEQTLRKIDPKKIDLIAATIGPGLEPCLWAGVRTARVLSLALGKPIVGVNHLEGHIAANFISRTSSGIQNVGRQYLSWIFPAICLIVSGGHTQLVLIEEIAARGEPRLWRGEYEKSCRKNNKNFPCFARKILGQTRDDAAGEAFDKVAKLLGLGYPGGPEIALNAKNGDSKAFDLPRPMIGSNNYDFSFSGLKTAVWYLLKKMNNQASQRHFCEHRAAGGATPPAPQIAKIPLACLDGDKVNSICASFQQAIIDVLISKTIRAAREYNTKAIMLSGGVATNQELRRQMSKKIKSTIPNSQFLVPSSQFCTDNAAMIGLAGYWKYQRQGADRIEKIIANANLNL